MKSFNKSSEKRVRPLLQASLLLLSVIAHTACAENPVVTTIQENFRMMPFPDSPEGKLAAEGKQLITDTYALLGPNSNHPVNGNRLACASCHLSAGTKPFAAPFVGLTGVFPLFVGRENKVETLEERINGCFERSMNGKAMDVNSHEMRAIVTYIKHLSKGVPVGKRIEGQGFTTLKVPDRAANTTHGAQVYAQHCATCHGANGQGVPGTADNRAGGYVFPPLWGSDSFNDGAGMGRILTAARYIKGNMPFGTKADAPVLTDEEAYDVAAFINSHARPEKSGKEKDYPDLARKPKDSPYPPYADAIPRIQHQFGPFNF